MANTLQTKQFHTRMHDLLMRAKKMEKGLTPELDALQTEFDTASAAGYKDWEDEISRNLKMLRIWVRKAEQGVGMTHADGHFTIGKTHTVCQDYVRVGKTPDGLAYAIVSDGCSSSKDTDIGARLLVTAAERYICGRKSPNSKDVDFDKISYWAEQAATFHGLNLTCLDATLMVVIEDGPFLAVYQMGDGVVAVRTREGQCLYTSQEFTTGAPFYPNYLQDANRLQALYDQPNSKVIITSGCVGDYETKEDCTIDDYYTKAVSGSRTLYQKKDVDIVALMTDGALSFR